MWLLKRVTPLYATHRCFKSNPATLTGYEHVNLARKPNTFCLENKLLECVIVDEVYSYSEYDFNAGHSTGPVRIF